MTPAERLKEIEDRFAKSTQGDWKLFDKGYDESFPTTVDFNRVMSVEDNVVRNMVWTRLGVPDKMCMEKTDAEFIEHIRQDLTYLIARVSRLTEDMQTLKDATKLIKEYNLRAVDLPRVRAMIARIDAALEEHD